MMQLTAWALLIRALWPALAQATVSYPEYILAPSSRTLYAESLYQSGGSVDNAAALLGTAGCSSQAETSAATFSGANSYVTLDFGKNIAGYVSFNVDSVAGTDEAIGVTFTESSEWISAATCDATQDAGIDQPLWFNLTGPGYYVASKEHQRGGFRYLTVAHNSTGVVDLSNLTVYWSASPEMADPTAYTGYFHSSSEKLNRVWYAGAYTNQLCSIDPTTGNALGLPTDAWYFNYTIANGTSVLVDGGKRDRLVWPGDIAISGPSIFVSTNSLVPIRNAIDSLMILQQADGRLPYAGNPFNDFVSKRSNQTVFLWSFTYHCHTLNDIYDYYLFTGDTEFLSSYWSQYKLGMNYVLQFIDSTGLANVTSSADWLRNGMGGHNIEANAILYFTLQNGLKLASVLNDTEPVSNWTTSASGLPAAADSILWDDTASLYYDNDTAAGQQLHPQDGNVWAVISGLTAGYESRAQAISTSLTARWIRPYGAPAPEAGATVSPFVSGFEVQAHYAAGFPERAVQLLEFMWADFMLDDPRVTNSTFIEGYSTDGSLHYPAYANDPRVSHAHGWATGPTSGLTFLAAGMRLTGAAGSSWEIAPQLGGLTEIEAGFVTSLGQFKVEWHNGTDGLSGLFETPEGTTGVLMLPVPVGAQEFTLAGEGCTRNASVDNASTVLVEGITGGKYNVTLA